MRAKVEEPRGGALAPGLRKLVAHGGRGEDDEPDDEGGLEDAVDQLRDALNAAGKLLADDKLGIVSMISHDGERSLKLSLSTGICGNSGGSMATFHHPAQ